MTVSHAHSHRQSWGMPGAGQSTIRIAWELTGMQTPRPARTHHIHRVSGGAQQAEPNATGNGQAQEGASGQGHAAGSQREGEAGRASCPCQKGVGQPACTSSQSFLPQLPRKTGAPREPAPLSSASPGFVFCSDQAALRPHSEGRDAALEVGCAPAGGSGGDGKGEACVAANSLPGNWGLHTRALLRYTLPHTSCASNTPAASPRRPPPSLALVGNPQVSGPSLAASDSLRAGPRRALPRGEGVTIPKQPHRLEELWTRPHHTLSLWLVADSLWDEA